MSSQNYDFTKMPQSMEEFWMPFTPQRLFKKDPRIVVSADGMYYKDVDGNKILDAIAGLWCVNAGHNAPKVKEAIKAQLDTLDSTLNFQYGCPTPFMAAEKLCKAMPESYNHVFFSNSGSEAVETALKMAAAYHHARGEGGRRVFIGRDRGYHGVNYGGISVCGLSYNRSMFGQLLPSIDHLPHTHNLEHNAFVKGQPEWGAHLADGLEELILFHAPQNVAAVIVEPVAGSTGILPPPKDYLRRLREITKKHGVLLIFDEVVTAFARMGEYSSTTLFGVEADILCMAKGLSNGVVPMGATLCTDEIYNSFMETPEKGIEFLHGYTYSGHPLASAALIGTLDTYADGKIMENARKMMKPLEDEVHKLKDAPRVVDIRNVGLMAAVQLETEEGSDPLRLSRSVSYELFNRDIVMRYSGPNIQISPSAIVTEEQIKEMCGTLREVIEDVVAGKVSH